MTIGYLASRGAGFQGVGSGRFLKTPRAAVMYASPNVEASERTGRSAHPTTEGCVESCVLICRGLVAYAPANETLGGSNAVVYAGPTEYSAKPLLWFTAVTRSPTRKLRTFEPGFLAIRPTEHVIQDTRQS